MDINSVIDKVARQIKGDWIDAWNYLSKLGTDKLNLSCQEKNLIKQYI